MVNEMNGKAPVDLLTGEALDLTVTGISLRAPDWWAPEVAEMLMGGGDGHRRNADNQNDPLVNSLTASFFSTDWVNADWDPESLDNFNPNANNGQNGNNNNNNNNSNGNNNGGGASSHRR